MTRRTIVKIDEEKCDGCGACVIACAEGALQVIDGKARLISETYCDGLGACLGECPRGAISIEEREAEQFDLEAAHRHVVADCALVEEGLVEDPPRRPPSPGQHRTETAHSACPGAAAQVLPQPRERAADDPGRAVQVPSFLANWPVQLRLAPVRAPYFDGSVLLVAADCVPFAFRAFHEHFLAGRTLLIGCSKLDDADLYRRKLAQILLQNDIREVEVAYMEVPCCYGLVHLVQQALRECGKNIPLTLTKVSITGDILETTKLAHDMNEGRKSA